jgi:SAM-dependent methyltransferase
VPTWDEAADWYMRMVADPTIGFNSLATEVALALVGAGAGRSVLDLGCGEGHVARRLAGAGARVVGVDPTRAFVEAARAAEAGHPLGIEYRIGDAHDLGWLTDGSIDVVVAVLVLHHLESVEKVLGEIARVLRPGGRLVAVIPHPWSDHPGAIWSAGRRIIGDYIEERAWADEGELESIRQIGWHHRTLATWINDLAAVGLAIDRVEEPTGADGARPDGGGHWAGVPRFFAYSARRVEPGARPGATSL